MTLKAGIILIKDNQIALIYRDKQKDYSFPKGHLEKNETIIECAIRETEEEIKRKVKLISEKEIYIEHYVTPSNEKCECHYFLGLDDGVSDNTSTDTHELIWTNYDKVESVLSYPSLKKVWNEIRNEVKKYLND